MDWMERFNRTRYTVKGRDILALRVKKEDEEEFHLEVKKFAKYNNLVIEKIEFSEPTDTGYYSRKRVLVTFEAKETVKTYHYSVINIEFSSLLCTKYSPDDYNLKLIGAYGKSESVRLFREDLEKLVEWANELLTL